jgi:sulfur relay (sulfurtransferase) complex TusBCD TusD component (DsrE family)
VGRRVLISAGCGSELPFDEQLLAGAHRSSMEELADWTLEADRIVTF